MPDTNRVELVELRRSKLGLHSYKVARVNVANDNLSKDEELNFTCHPEVRFASPEIDESEYRFARLSLYCAVDSTIHDGFHIDVEIVAEFKYSDPDISDEEYMRLLLQNGVAIVFPYMRHTISALSNICNVATIIVPVFDFTNSFSEGELIINDYTNAPVQQEE